MECCNALDAFPASGPDLVLTVGAFDGLHTGHLALIAHANELARERGLASWVLTFDPHPVRVLRPESAPPLLTTRVQREHILAELGIDGGLFLPFDLDMASWSPEEFIDRLYTALHGRLKQIVVGEDWRFGLRSSGDTALLAEILAGRGVGVEAMALVAEGGERISSTRIRQTLRDGKVSEATHLLGRRYEVRGVVVHGRKFGRELGFPTANLQSDNEMLPAPGIYAMWVRHRDAWMAAAGYISGHDACAGLLELHLLDGEHDLYDCRLEAEFVLQIREDRAFGDLEALKHQIAEDVTQVRKVLASGRDG